MNEDRPKAAPEDSGKEVEQESTGGGRRAYDPERYSPVTVAAWQRVPASTARAFAIASARGRLIGANSADRIRSGRDVHGSVVGPNKLPDVLEALAESDRTWRRHVLEWEAQYLAHRCSRGRVCLFTKPLPAVCPACGAEIVYDHPEKLTRRKPPAPRDGHGRFTSNGRTRSGRVAVARPDEWPYPVHSSGRTRSASEHDPATPGNRSLLGLEVGLSLTQPSEEAAVSGALAVEELPRGRFQETTPGELEWISPFVDRSCPECGAWPHQGDHFAGCSHRTTIRGASA